MFYLILLSLEEKRCAIITDEHVIYELPHEFAKDLRLTIVVKWEISVKYKSSPLSSLPAKMKKALGCLKVIWKWLPGKFSFAL